MNTPSRSVVELHRHDRDKPVIFRSQVTFMRWSSSVAPPHGRASVGLALPVSKFDLALPGDWMVIRDGGGRTVFFGHVVNVSDGVSVADNLAVTSDVVTVDAESWLDMLSRVEVFAPETAAMSQSVGTLFTLSDWAQITSSIIEDQVFGNLGEALQTWFKSIARIRLPRSLGGGGWLNELIPVAHDKSTQVLYAPDIVIEELPSAGALPTHISMLSVRSNVYHLLRSMFVPEPSLIELFPHLSPLYEELPALTLTGITAHPTPFSGGNISANKDSVTLVETEYETESGWYQSTSLTEYLRVRPVIIYRVKPWRTRPLYQSLFAAVDEARRYISTENYVNTKNADSPNLSDWGQQQILASMFSAITWAKEYYTILPLGRTVSIRRTRTDDDRINCAFINLSITDILVLEQSGLPVKVTEEIERHGLRSANPTWPFIITPDDPLKTNNFVLYMRGVAAQIMQFYHRGHAFGSGTVNIAGGVKIATFTERDGKFQWPLQAGRPFSVALPGKPFAGYAESVSNSIEVRGTNITGATNIEYSRGIYGEDEDWLRDSLIPISDAPPAGSFIGRSYGSQVNTRPAGPIADPFPDCKAGKPSDDPKFSLGGLVTVGDWADEFYKPPWLKAWALSRCGPNLAASMRSSFDGRLGASQDKTFVREENNGFQVLDNTPLYHKDVVWFMAAAAYVIERYWRQKFPGAQIFLPSWYRAGDKQHDKSTAIDFYIQTNDASMPRVPALQAWASLAVLAAHGRIPIGGRGIYLNVNPITGIKGTAPDQAGQSSSNKGGPGSSGGTHYDLRFAFGVYAKARGYWLACDWTGDGNDEIQRGANDPAEDAKGNTVLSTFDDVYRVIADPQLTLKAKFAGQSTLIADMYTKKAPVPGGFSRDSWGKEGEDAAYKNVRAPVEAYIKAAGDDWRTFGKKAHPVVNDPWLPDVTSYVPNIRQVLGYEQSCFYDFDLPNVDLPVASATQLINQPPGAASAQTTPETDPGYGTFYPAAFDNAPVVYVFGGTKVNGRLSGEYMLDYLKSQPVITDQNNVFVARSNTAKDNPSKPLDGRAAVDWVNKQVKGTPRTKILYLFSGGQWPCQAILNDSEMIKTFDFIFLVDPYLENSFSLYLNKVEEDKNKFLFFYTPAYKTFVPIVSWVNAESAIVTTTAGFAAGSKLVVFRSDKDIEEETEVVSVLPVPPILNLDDSIDIEDFPAPVFEGEVVSWVASPATEVNKDNGMTQSQINKIKKLCHSYISTNHMETNTAAVGVLIGYIDS